MEKVTKNIETVEGKKIYKLIKQRILEDIEDEKLYKYKTHQPVETLVNCVDINKVNEIIEVIDDINFKNNEVHNKLIAISNILERNDLGDFIKFNDIDNNYLHHIIND